MKNSNNLIWIDLEMTGLDPDENIIIEIATIITDSDLNILAEGPYLAIFQPQNSLDKMDEWNTKQHSKSGLIKRVQDSHITLAEAERQTLDFISQYVDKNTSPMCGNSICLDRQFLRIYMPKLCQYFHYRHIDVSTLKELAKRWRPDIKKHQKKNSAHLALSDIYDSIAELKHYRQQFVRLKS